MNPVLQRLVDRSRGVAAVRPRLGGIFAAPEPAPAELAPVQAVPEEIGPGSVATGRVPGPQPVRRQASGHSRRVSTDAAPNIHVDRTPAPVTEVGTEPPGEAPVPLLPTVVAEAPQSPMGTRILPAAPSVAVPAPQSMPVAQIATALTSGQRASARTDSTRLVALAHETETVAAAQGAAPGSDLSLLLPERDAPFAPLDPDLPLPGRADTQSTEIRIGQIEVRGRPEPKVPPPARQPTQLMSLEDYLAQGRGRK